MSEPKKKKTSKKTSKSVQKEAPVEMEPMAEMPEKEEDKGFFLGYCVKTGEKLYKKLK